MKQVLIERGQAIVDDVPAPVIGTGQILIEVAYSLISTGTELSSVKSSGQSLVEKALAQPERVKKVIDYLRSQGIRKTVARVQQTVSQASPTGYSCSGTVIQVGEDISDIQPGDHVACAGAGIANHAEIVLVPRNLVVRIPDGCGLRAAATVTIGAIAMQGVRRADPRLGETVAVIGLGLLGQITVQLLKAAGCRVVGFDLDAQRVTLARQLGADHTFNSLNVDVDNVDVDNEIRHLTDDYGVDSTIITAASESDAIIQQAMEITRKKGKVVVVGAVGLGLKRSPFYEKEIDLLISCSYGPGRYDEQYERKGLDYPYAYVRWTENRNMQEYLRLIGANKVNVEPIMEREYPVDQAQQAYAVLNTADERPLGVLLTYPSGMGRPQKDKLSTKVILRSQSSTGKISVALIGAGNFAKQMHLPNLQKLSDQYHLRAVVDIVGSNAKATAQQFGAEYATTEYEDVLSDDGVDMVLITTRHSLHVPFAVRAARAGKAIFVEKPMALNRTELNELVSVLNQTRVPFMVGYNRRFSAAAHQIRKVIGDRQNPLMILYRMNAGYIPREHWTQAKEQGGRIIGEACHIFDLFQYLVGPHHPVDVVDTSILPKRAHIVGEDNTVVTIRYDDGSVATLLYTALGNRGLDKEYAEVYSDGMVVVLEDYHSLRVYGSSAKGWASRSQDKGHLAELEAFSRYMRGEASAPIPLEEMIATTEISFTAANQGTDITSAQTGGD